MSLFLFSCYLAFSLFFSTTEAQINSTLEKEFVHTPQRKEKILKQLDIDLIKQTIQTKQIIEIQKKFNIHENIPIPSRKRILSSKLKNLTKSTKVKNEIKNDKNSNEGKKNELVVAEIISSIRNKLTKCWSIPESIAFNKVNLNIKINLLLSDQGEIIIADIVDINSYKSNSLFRSVADSAMRAAYKCSPITDLPIEYYYIWREITLDFILNG
ncbi:MAG: hypothetical protein LKM44_02920 [Wolbachia endosymbiont of Meromenopon meropis]|nr:hypothetical protein [Wolbachia endosymbiont of Meromenopon meropis]